MLKRFLAFSFLALTLLPFNFVAAQGSNNKSKDSKTVNQRFDIMHENQNESTDTLAIPLDDSEIEDQEELDYVQNRPFRLEIPVRENTQNNTSQERNR